MKLEFLGTGAADWRGPAANGELRRMTSTRFDGALLIDLTASALEQKIVARFEQVFKD